MAHRPDTRDGHDQDIVSDVDRLLSRLTRFDDDIVHLIMQRARLMNDLRRSLPAKTGKRTHPEVEVEKKLWRAFEQLAPKGVKDPAMWRTLFTLIHSMEPGGRPARDRDEEAFLLSPKQAPLDLSLAPPPSQDQAAAWTVLAAQCADPAELAPVVLNDPLIELVKGLNQCGAHLSWEEHSVVSRGTDKLAFSEKVVHCGEYDLTFYTLLFLAATMPCSIKYTGGAGLKLGNFKPLDAIMAGLGARLVFMAPRSAGLPVRIEASAMLPQSLELPANFPAQALQALALVACRFPDGLAITWPREEEYRLRPALDILAPVFAAWSLSMELEEGKASFAPGTPALAEPFSPGADPMLSAVFLSLPMFTELGSYNTGASRARLNRFPAEGGLWQGYARLMHAAGIVLNTDDTYISSAFKPQSDPESSPLLDASFHFQAFPTALALALAMLTLDLRKKAIGRIGIVLPRDYAQVDAARELALRFGAESRVEERDNGQSILVLKPTGKGFDPDAGEPWTSPGPDFSLALAMLSYIRSGLRLTNPGNMTGLLPGFWILFNTLPNPQVDFLFRNKTSKDNDNDKPQRNRRRIRT